jgi:ribosome biogenesis GTPase A
VVAIIGMPNVGKSSVINALRRHAGGRGKAVRVGATPGLTRNISGIKVQDDPPMMVLDTPGVLVPATRLQPLAGLKLALACSL